MAWKLYVGDRVFALPKFKQDQRSSRRELAALSIQARFRKWLEGPQGPAWRYSRTELHSIAIIEDQ